MSDSIRDAWRRRNMHRRIALVTLTVSLLATGCGGSVAVDVSPSPLGHTFASPDALAEAVLTALAEEDNASLEALPLSELEFRTVVWPELPSSRPDHGLPFDYVWGDLHQKSTNARLRLIARHGGKHYELLGVEFDGETTMYETYRVHRETVLTVRDQAGDEVTFALFGSILERDGEFKLFSYVID